MFLKFFIILFGNIINGFSVFLWPPYSKIYTLHIEIIQGVLFNNSHDFSDSFGHCKKKLKNPPTFVRYIFFV